LTARGGRRATGGARLAAPNLGHQCPMRRSLEGAEALLEEVKANVSLEEPDPPLEPDSPL
jgi:hypothetical protein